MAQFKKLLILFVVLIATTILSLPSPIHASRQHKDDFSLSPKPQQYELDQEQNMEAPYSSQDNNNNEEEDIDLYYNSPSSYAPSPSPSPAPVGPIFSDESDNDDNAPYGDDDDAVPPQVNDNVLPFSYSAEDDAGEFTNEYYSNQGVYHVEKKHVAVVVGAVCLVGLGGFVFKRRNQKRKQYHNLYYKRDEV